MSIQVTVNDGDLMVDIPGMCAVEGCARYKWLNMLRYGIALSYDSSCPEFSLWHYDGHLKMRTRQGRSEWRETTLPFSNENAEALARRIEVLEVDDGGLPTDKKLTLRGQTYAPVNYNSNIWQEFANGQLYDTGVLFNGVIGSALFQYDQDFVLVLTTDGGTTLDIKDLRTLANMFNVAYPPK